MDANLVEFVKFVAPPIAAAVATYFAARERIRVLEVKLEALSDVVKELRGNIQQLQQRSW